jgi:hypothetical protein
MKVKSCKDVISFCKDVTLFKDAVIISVLFFIKCDICSAQDYVLENLHIVNIMFFLVLPMLNYYTSFPMLVI